MPQPVQYRGMALIVPDNDSEWKEFYEHARAHRLVVRKCKACGLMRYPPTHACPWCMELAPIICRKWRRCAIYRALQAYHMMISTVSPSCTWWLRPTC